METSKGEKSDGPVKETPVKRKPVLGTLLWKNMKLKLSKPVSSLFEILLPMLLVVGFSQLKGETDIFKVPEGWSLETESCAYDFPEGSFNKSCVYPYSRFLNTVPSFDVAAQQRLNGNLARHPYAKVFVAHDESPSGIEFMEDFLAWATSEGAAETDYVSTFNSSYFILGRGTEEEAFQYMKNPTYGKPFTPDKPEVAGLLVFEERDVESHQYRYKVRLNSTNTDLFRTFRTRHIRIDGTQRSMDTRLLRRATTDGFLTMQLLVDQFIIGGGEYDSDYMPFVVQTLPFPVTDYQVDEFFGFVTQVFGLFYILCYLWPVSQLMNALVSEKETRMREMMRMMGVSDNQLFGSWFITYAVTFFILSLVLTAVSAVMFPSTSAGGFPWLIFCLFYLFSLCTLSFCYLFSAFFWKARTGAIIGVTLYFVGFYAYYQANDFEEGKPPGLLLIPQVAFALSIQSLSQLEFRGVGLTMDNLSTQVEGFAVGDGLAFLLVDFFLFTIVGWYLNQVVPQEFGKPQPLYFPLLPSYWLPPKASGSDSASTGSESVHSDDSVDPEAVQPVGPSLQSQIRHKRCVQIKNLRRVFDTPSGEKVAVKRLNLDMFEGQVLALLGHNGAGKTTTLSCLAGMIMPSDGTAIIRGLDIRKDMSVIRQSLGFCPQHDVLYNELTVKDHLEFYGSIKGLRGKALKEAVAEKISQVGLTEKVNARTKSLSGGQKRKLSVAIALIGDSKVVFLDEPTSGMDPFSRRSTWELIQNNRDGRVIVLTTHFMDEADILGDRIAIMAEGELRCVGDSLFLKTRYGEGYTLTLVKSGSNGQKTESGSSTVTDSAPAIEAVTSAVPGAKLVTNVGAEIAFQLPIDQTDKFAQMFKSLDGNMQPLGIEQYGISVTTMDEVFLKVAAGETGAAIEGKPRVGDVSDDSTLVAGEVAGLENMGAWETFWLHFRTLYLKRVRFARRDIKSFVCIAVLPLILITFGLIVITITPIGQPEPELVHGYDALNVEYPDSNFLMPVVPVDEAADAVEALRLKPQPSAVVLGSDPDRFGKRVSVLDARSDAERLNLKDPREAQELYGRNYANGVPVREECLQSSCRNPTTAVGGGVLTLAQTLLGTSQEPRTNGTTTYTGAVMARVPRPRKSCNTIDFGALQSFSLSTDEVECTDGQDLCMYVELSLDLSALEVDLGPDLGDVLDGLGVVNLCAPAGCLGDSLRQFSSSNSSALAGLGDSFNVDVSAVLETLSVFVCNGNGCNVNRVNNVFSLLDSNSACRDPNADKSEKKDDLCVVPGLIEVELEEDLSDYDLSEDTNTCTDVSRRLGQVEDAPHLRRLADSNCTNSLPELEECKTGCRQIVEEEACDAVDVCAWNGFSCSVNCAHLDSNSTCSRSTTFGLASGSDCEWLEEGVCVARKRLSYLVMANTTFKYNAEHAMNKFNTALLRTKLENQLGPEVGRRANITVVSHPFPQTQQIDELIDGFKAFTTAIFIVVAYAFVPAAVMGYVVLEKETCKHQQTVAGVGPIAYWCSMFAFDMTTFLFPVVCTVVLISAFEVESFTAPAVLGCIVLLLLAYGLAVMPFTYVLSHAFSRHTTAQNMALLVNLLTGLVLMITSFVLDALETTQDVNVSLKYVYRIFPGFCLGDSVQQLALRSILNALFQQALPGQEPTFSPYDLDVTGTNFIYLLLSFVVWSTIAIGFDLAKSYPALWAKLVRESTRVQSEKTTGNKDDDVMAEERRVTEAREGDPEAAQAEDIVTLLGIRKVYRGGKVAVKGVTLGIPRGQCFGYLGINGAGKTTTLKCLTGDVSPTSGAALLGGVDIQSHPAQVRRLVGYCPQFDALLDLLTVREHLEMYARIKAVPADQLESVIQAKMRELTLEDFEHKVARTLSGGNKRKLSVAIAMIGNPKVMFLDEPSTGMDPVSRRKMWDVIARMSTDARQTAVVLTSHSMEECEALCDRVGIMVGGEMQCLGPIQHLKNKYGSGLMVEVKIAAAPSTRVDELMSEMSLGPELTVLQVQQFCERMKDGLARMALIDGKKDVAWSIWKSLESEGVVDSKSLILWWFLQDAYDKLDAFLKSNFDKVNLVESHEYHFRFRFPKDVLQSRGLGDIFGVFESNKEDLGLAEYSVSQTSLEQIFNQFAANQDEERGVARGFVAQ